MAGRGYIGTSKSPFDDMQDAIAGVHKRLDMFIAASKQATMPSYPFETANPGDLPDNPIQGQVAISHDDDTLWFYSNGAWHQAASNIEYGIVKRGDFLPPLAVSPGVDLFIPWNQFTVTNNKHIFNTVSGWNPSSATPTENIYLSAGTYYIKCTISWEPGDYIKQTRFESIAGGLAGFIDEQPDAGALASPRTWTNASSKAPDANLDHLAGDRTMHTITGIYNVFGPGGSGAFRVVCNQSSGSDKVVSGVYNAPTSDGVLPPQVTIVRLGNPPPIIDGGPDHFWQVT